MPAWAQHPLPGDLPRPMPWPAPDSLILANQTSITIMSATEDVKLFYDGLVGGREIPSLLDSFRLRSPGDWWQPVLFAPDREKHFPVPRDLEERPLKREIFQVKNMLESAGVFIYRYGPCAGSDAPSAPKARSLPCTAWAAWQEPPGLPCRQLLPGHVPRGVLFDLRETDAAGMIRTLAERLLNDSKAMPPTPVAWRRVSVLRGSWKTSFGNAGTRTSS